MDWQGLFGLKGHITLITGASSGIGLHVAQLFAKAGSDVVLAARRKDRTERAASSLRSNGHRAMAVPMDVTDPDSIGPAFDAAKRFLGRSPDILVNNAGMLIAEKFLDQKDEDAAHLIDTNLMGPFRVAQEAARRMADAKGGAIINVASTSGLRAGGFMASYAASKAGLIHLGNVMALELAGKNIRVNTVCPGNIETEMQEGLSEFEDSMKKRTPMRRFGQAQDLDGALLLLASDAGRYMTGAVVTVDGGQALSWM